MYTNYTATISINYTTAETRIIRCVYEAIIIFVVSDIPRVSQRLPLDGFSSDFIPYLVKLGHQQQIFYLKT